MDEPTLPVCPGCGAVAVILSDDDGFPTHMETIHDDDCSWMHDPNAESYE